MTEVEESNDAYRLRKVRLMRAIRKMRLERAYLLETLGKRMKKNSPDALSGFYDEYSEGSSDGPPTPREKPLRTKRSHRRHIAASPAPNANNVDSSFMNETPKFQAYQPSSKSSQNHISSSKDTAVVESPTNGHHAPEDSFPTASSPSQPNPSNTLHPMVPPLPPADAFAMYLDGRFLSQPHKHPQANSEQALIQLAEESWENESEGTKQLYKLQEAKQRQAYNNQRTLSLEYEKRQQQQRKETERKRNGAENGDEDEEDEDEDEQVKVEGAGSTAAGGGFTSIN